MAVAAVLVIVVALGDAQDPASVAIAGAAAEALGGDVVLRGAAVPDDARALAIESEVGAAASAQIVWDDAVHTRARVRVHAGDRARAPIWIEKQIAFASDDTPVERGRALGFAAASMLPEAARAEVSAPPADARARALGVAVTGAAGVGGPAGGLGGALDLDVLMLGGRLSGRLGAGVRAGPLRATDGTDLVASLGAGAALWLVSPALRDRFGLGLAARALLIAHAISHGPPASSWRARFLPGADVALEARWRLAGRWEALVSGGAEIAFGTTDIVVAERRVTTIPAVRATAAAGVRLRF